MIKSIEMKNWTSHAHSKLEFSPGVNGLIGIMGSGKSSVTNAICFGLFGTFPQLQEKKIRLEDIVSKKSAKTAELNVEFAADGKSYSVKRNISVNKRTESAAELKEDGKLIEANPKRVTEMVEQVLKTDYELFSRAVYSEQNRLDYFLTIAKGQRMKKIDELLGIARFEQARSAASTSRNKLESMNKTKKAMLEGFESPDETKMEQLGNEIEKLGTESSEMKKGIEILDAGIPNMNRRMAEIEKIRDLHEKLITQQKTNEANIDGTRKHIENIKEKLSGKDLEKLESDVKKVSEEANALGAAINRDRETLAAISRIVSEAKARTDLVKENLLSIQNNVREKEISEKQLKELNEKFGDIEKYWKEQRKNFETEMMMFQTLQARLSDVEESLKKIESVEGVCPLCESVLQLGQKMRVIGARKNHIEALRNDIELYRKKTEERRKYVEESERVMRKSILLAEKTKDIDAMKNEFENNSKKLEQLSKTGQEETERMERIRKDIQLLENQLDEKRKHFFHLGNAMDWAKEYGKLLGELENFIKKNDEIQSEIAEIGPKIKDIDINSLRSEIQEKTGLRRELAIKITSNDAICKEKMQKLGEMKNKLNVYKKYQQDIKKIEKIVYDLEIFSFALESTQVYLREQFIEAVNIVMSEIWEQLYPYGDFAEVKLNIEEGDYSLQLRDRIGKWTNADVASGGERSIACLALRIAFSLALAPNLKWLVLDEPTHNLDAKAVEDLANTLRYGVKDVINQVFLITHDEKLEDAVTGTLYRLERDKSRDEATKVIRLE